jgi:hypothetical protein
MTYDPRLNAIADAGGVSGGGIVTWAAVLAKPTTVAGFGITDAVTPAGLASGLAPYATVASMNAALALKAAVAHTHATADVTGLDAALAGKADVGHTHGYASLTGVPAMFAPSAHVHPTADVTGLDASLAGKAAAVHTHAQADVTGLAASLAGKADAAHTHAYGTLTGIPATFAPSAHVHPTSEVTGLDAALAAKATPADVTAGANAAVATHAALPSHLTANQQAALAGTSGTAPSAANKLVDASDARLVDARTPLAHTHPVAQLSDATAAGRNLLTAADAPAQRTALGLGTAATTASTAYEAAGASAAAVTAHVALPDPHAQYALESTLGAAGGIATLDATGRLTIAQEPILRRALAVDQAAIGVAASTIAGLQLPLAAGKRYRVTGHLVYTVAAGTALFALRLTYSGTLGAAANGNSEATFSATSGNPTVWAALSRMNVVAVNGAMPTTVGGPGNTGAAATLATVDITGTIFTGTAGNLDVAAIASVAAGFVPKAGSWLEVLELP